MEALAAISLAGNIIQFIDFGTKLLSKGGEIYRSSDGALKDDKAIEAIVKHLQATIDRLKSITPNPRPPAKILRDECIELIKELLDALSKLKVQGKVTKWKSFRKAFKSVRSKAQVELWLRRLESMRETYNIALEVDLIESIDLHAAQLTHDIASLDTSQKALTLTVLDALRDDRDNFEAVAEKHAIKLEDLIKALGDDLKSQVSNETRTLSALVTSEHSITRAQGLAERHAVEAHVDDQFKAAHYLRIAQHEETRLHTEAQHVRTRGDVQQSLHQYFTTLTDHVSQASTKQLLDLSSHDHAQRHAHQDTRDHVTSETALVTQQLTDAIEVNSFVTDLNLTLAAQEFARTLSEQEARSTAELHELTSLRHDLQRLASSRQPLPNISSNRHNAIQSATARFDWPRPIQSQVDTVVSSGNNCLPTSHNSVTTEHAQPGELQEGHSLDHDQPDDAIGSHPTTRSNAKMASRKPGDITNRDLLRWVYERMTNRRNHRLPPTYVKLEEPHVPSGTALTIHIYLNWGASPDWGGPGRKFGASAERIEPLGDDEAIVVTKLKGTKEDPATSLCLQLLAQPYDIIAWIVASKDQSGTPAWYDKLPDLKTLAFDVANEIPPVAGTRHIASSIQTQYENGCKTFNSEDPSWLRLIKKRHRPQEEQYQLLYAGIMRSIHSLVKKHVSRQLICSHEDITELPVHSQTPLHLDKDWRYYVLLYWPSPMKSRMYIDQWAMKVPEPPWSFVGSPLMDNYEYWPMPDWMLQSALTSVCSQQKPHVGPRFREATSNSTILDFYCQCAAYPELETFVVARRLSTERHVQWYSNFPKLDSFKELSEAIMRQPSLRAELKPNKATAQKTKSHSSTQ